MCMKPGMGFESETVEKQKWGHHHDLQLKVFRPLNTSIATSARETSSPDRTAANVFQPHSYALRLDAWESYDS
jgi:hypothetical protein